MLTCAQHSRNLIKCLSSGDKLELAEITSSLMPGGKPDFKAIVNYPTIAQLVVQMERKPIRMAIFLMVKNFCESLNVVRNMNEDQMIEAASFLLDECGNFRMEDYQMMFALAKRGQIGKILDRVDIQVISTILDKYWEKRNNWGRKEQEEYFSDNFQQRPKEGDYVPDEIVSKTWGEFRLQLEEQSRVEREKEDAEMDKRIQERRQQHEKLQKFLANGQKTVYDDK